MTQRKSKPIRKFLPTIIIYCEGETEKNYLDAMKDDRYASKRIKIKPELPDKSDYKHVFPEINNLLNEISDIPNALVFYVLDMDVIHNQNKYDVYQIAKRKIMNKKGVKGRLFIIESRPCIEFWFLIHFIFTDKLYHNSGDVIVDLRKRKYIEDYSKERKVSEKTYQITKNRLETAISYAKTISNKTRTDNEEFSYSDIHVLIEMLDKIEV